MILAHSKYSQQLENKLNPLNNGFSIRKNFEQNFISNYENQLNENLKSLESRHHQGDTKGEKRARAEGERWLAKQIAEWKGD